MSDEKLTLITIIKDKVAFAHLLLRLQDHIEPRRLERPVHGSLHNLAAKDPCSDLCTASIVELQERQSHGH